MTLQQTEKRFQPEEDLAARGPGQPSDDPLLDGLLLLCQLNHRPASAAELTAGLPLVAGRLTPGLLPRAAARADFDLRVGKHKLASLPAELLPALVLLDDGDVMILLGVKGDECLLVHPHMPAREVRLGLAAVQARSGGRVALAAPMPRRDGRTRGLIAEPKGHWFWGEVARFWPNFLEIAFAAGLANLLGIVTSLFAMQVYDRVVPNLAFATLWVLAIGAGIAIGIEALLRIVRSHLLDRAGRRLDLALSSRIFERAIGIRLEAQPRSVGAFAAQVREFDAVREFFTSTTIGALSDLPFVALFITIVALIGGPVAYVLLAAIPLIVLPGIVAQWPISRLSRENLREGAVRNGLLMEALSGLETVKTTQAEGRFQRLWEDYSAQLTGNGIRMRAISAFLTFSAVAVQQAAYVAVIVVGVYLIADGEMTVGALLACSILSSRTIAPLTQLAGILSRWQQMRAALAAISNLMEAPVERPAERQFVHRPRLRGAYRIEELSFGYDPDANAALQIKGLSIAPGSATAVLGTNGSGKSTLLKLLAGLYHPAQGQLLLDQTDIRQIDPADLRRAIGYLPQDVRLFYGTLRDNLRLGCEGASDEDLLEALAFAGGERLVQEHPLGLDRPITEGGAGLSGGQRQSVGLARLWLRDPRIVLLDEPTAALDHGLELALIGRMKTWAEGRTLIVATHRQPVLDLVDQAVVLNGGRLAASGPVGSVMASLAANRPAQGPQTGGEGAA